MKKIVVLTGSPRAGGNSEQMADIFISESQAKGHDVVKIRCAELDLLGCRACDCCYKDDKPCLMEKNFNTIAPVIQEAAVVVVFSPLYWFSFPAQLKAVIDKFYAYMQGGRGIGGKECAAVFCGATDLPSDFDGITASWKLITDYLKWDNKKTVCVCNAEAIGDIEKTDGLEQARQLAQLF